MSARIGVVVFPGSNCEHDVVQVLRGLGGTAELVWHATTSVAAFDAIVLPGGFAHGDYLRPGAIARFSPVMQAVRDFAGSGGPVLGICNGFQVLTEAGFLPGALQKNRGLKFICSMAELVVGSTDSVLTAGAARGDILRIPINHFEGNYTCDEVTLAALEGEDRIVLRYAENPNGSLGNIAGIRNREGNVVGLMPHPERACDALLGSVDGAVLMRSFLDAGAAGREHSPPAATRTG